MKQILTRLIFVLLLIERKFYYFWQKACTNINEDTQERPQSWSTSKRAHDVNITSPERRCNVMTLHRRWGDVIFTVCACRDVCMSWPYLFYQTYVYVMLKQLYVEFTCKYKCSLICSRVSQKKYWLITVTFTCTHHKITSIPRLSVLQTSYKSWKESKRSLDHGI